MIFLVGFGSGHQAGFDSGRQACLGRIFLNIDEKVFVMLSDRIIRVTATIIRNIPIPD